jgi:hypothetical protein
MTCNAPRFPIPAEEQPSPRRGGTFPMEEVSFSIIDGEFYFFDNPEAGMFGTDLQIDYIIEAGCGDDEFEVTIIRASAPGQENWQRIHADNPIYWAIEGDEDDAGLLRQPAIAEKFAAWREENSSFMPRQAVNLARLYEHLTAIQNEAA